MVCLSNDRNWQNHWCGFVWICLVKKFHLFPDDVINKISLPSVLVAMPTEWLDCCLDILLKGETQIEWGIKNPTDWYLQTGDAEMGLLFCAALSQPFLFLSFCAYLRGKSLFFDTKDGHICRWVRILVVPVPKVVCISQYIWPTILKCLINNVLIWLQKSKIGMKIDTIECSLIQSKVTFLYKGKEKTGFSLNMMFYALIGLSQQSLALQIQGHKFSLQPGHFFFWDCSWYNFYSPFPTSADSKRAVKPQNNISLFMP